MKVQRIYKLGFLVAACIAAFAATARAEILTVKVPSAVMKRDIPATVTVPKGYQSTDAPRPVLYLLHGAGDNERGWCDRTPVQEMADTYGVIIVTPSVGLSWYFDSPEDKNIQVETFVSSELVQYVDAHYCTIARREGRALAGNSMGGHGTMFLAIRHKDIFSAAAPMSGGMDIRPFPDNWGIKNVLGTIQAHPDRWNELTVINQVDSLKPGELAISIDCGTEDFFLQVNRQLHEKLTARGIAHNYAEFPGQHNWAYWKLALPRQMAFLDQHFKNALAPAPKPGDANYPAPAPSTRHLQKVAAVKSGHFDLVLIGDSITHTLDKFGGKYTPLEAVWNKHYAPRHAINLAHNGYRTEQILWNLQNGELDFTSPPKVVMLLIGTNNADSQHFSRMHTPEQIFAGTKAIVDLIRKRLPTTKILVLRIFPKGLRSQRQEGTSPPIFSFSEAEVETARRAGELTAQLADGKQVFWLDVNYVFLRPDGTINTDMLWDLLHPSPAGAEAWAQAVEPTLAQLMGDKPIMDANPYSSVIPVSRTDGGYDWMARHNAILAAKNTNPKIIFIGDSITHYLGGIPTPTGPFTSHRGNAFWDAITKNRPGLNLGFGADWTQHVLWRMDHGELDGLSPQRVVLMIGTNNVLWGNGNSDEIVAGVRACLLRIRAKVPDAKITLMAVLPCRNPATDPKRLLVAQVNLGLTLLAKEAKIDYLDIGAKFLDAQGNIPASLMSDTIHPTTAGYEIWRAALEPELKADDNK